MFGQVIHNHVENGIAWHLVHNLDTQEKEPVVFSDFRSLPAGTVLSFDDGDVENAAIIDLDGLSEKHIRDLPAEPLNSLFGAE